MDKEFLLQRITIFFGQTPDLSSDAEIKRLLRERFDIRLPQRRTLEESLQAVASDHELLPLILRYRLL